MRPSDGNSRPLWARIENRLQAVVFGRTGGGRTGEQRSQAARPHDRIEVAVAAPFQKVPVGEQQRVVTVEQDADRNAIEQRLLESRSRRRRTFAGSRRQLRALRSRRRPRRGFGASAQARGEFLRQFAECPPLDRAERRRRLRLGRLGSGGKGTTLAAPDAALIVGRSASDSSGALTEAVCAAVSGGAGVGAGAGITASAGCGAPVARARCRRAARGVRARAH